MAQLSSPGVSVTVIDESFYTPAAAGTVPLFIVASASNKQNSSATGTAPGTLKANAGTVYLLTSQKDLGDTFGVPLFYTDSGSNPIHAGEQNEYGLQAAYSFLGVSNRAYVVRADLDLGQLSGTASAPTSPPADGTYWLDALNTLWGVFTWNQNSATTTGGQTFSNQVPLVITNSSYVDGSNAPLSSYGAIGQFAVVATTTLLKIWYKKPTTSTVAGTWVQVGSSAWTASIPTCTGNILNANITLLSGDGFSINGTNITGVTTLTGLVSAINANSTLTTAGITAAIVNNYLQLFSNGTASYSTYTTGSIVLSGTSVAKVGLNQGSNGAATTWAYLCPALATSPHTSVPLFKITDNTTYINGRPSGSVWVKTTYPNLGALYFVKKYSAASSAWQLQTVGMYQNGQSANYALDPTGGGINLAAGTVYVKYNDDEGTPSLADFKIYYRTGVGATTITSAAVTSSTFTAGTNTFTIQESIVGSTSLNSAISISFTATGATSDATLLLTALNAAGFVNVVGSLNSSNQIIISHKTGGEMRLVDGTNTPLSKLFSTTTTANYFVNPAGTANNYVASLWSSTIAGSGFITVSTASPTNVPSNGTLWYNSALTDVDIMVNNGTSWVGYLNYTQNQAGGGTTDPNGPIISASQPTVQSTGAALANGDLWILSSDTEGYPDIYKFNYVTKSWVLINDADHTSENGVIFYDARWNTSGANSSTPGTIVSLLSSNYVDPDCPSPQLYPKGMLLWNLRRSSYNVKKYVSGYINSTLLNTQYNNEPMSAYFTDRWVTPVPDDYQGKGQFGRHAQRALVLQALTATCNSNQQIRDTESRVFNLMACPGYTEMISPLVNLNYDRGLTSFIVGDTPARLTPDATSLANWGNNTAVVPDNGEKGLVTTDATLGVFYPWGYTTDLIGNNIVVPPSHMMLRTIALNDNVAYPWFAPAGVRRGGITNASSTGYVDSTGLFQAVALNGGQRDTLASIQVNPLTYLQGTGLVCYGQYTRQLASSSLNRINVTRLVIYLRRQLNLLAKPYIFEPNDTITRNEIKQAAEQLFLELVGQRAIYDFLVVCDTSNNTPARIDRSELWLDIAIEPVKSVEFIYIPLRLKNTGAIKGLGSK
jgi:hypothetical protein